MLSLTWNHFNIVKFVTPLKYIYQIEALLSARFIELTNSTLKETFGNNPRSLFALLQYTYQILSIFFWLAFRKCCILQYICGSICYILALKRTVYEFMFVLIH